MREKPEHDDTTGGPDSAEAAPRPERRPWQTPHVIESTISTQTGAAANLPDDGPFSVS